MSSSKGIHDSLIGEDLGFYIFSSKPHCPKRRKVTGWGVENPES